MYLQNVRVCLCILRVPVIFSILTFQWLLALLLWNIYIYIFSCFMLCRACSIFITLSSILYYQKSCYFIVFVRNERDINEITRIVTQRKIDSSFIRKFTKHSPEVRGTTQNQLNTCNRKTSGREKKTYSCIMTWRANIFLYEFQTGLGTESAKGTQTLLISIMIVPNVVMACVCFMTEAVREML